MSLLSKAIAVALALATSAVGEKKPTVVVTGATGHLGSLAYAQLKADGADVRAFVRSADKAKSVLGCDKCDETEGIYVGDLTKPETIAPAMKGADTLCIVTSAEPDCSAGWPNCDYHKGAYPVDIDFHGGKAQIAAFATATKGKGAVVLISASGTTDPENPLDKMGNGHIGFYKLNEEASLLASGLPFTIIKPCGLSDDAPGKVHIVVGHDDNLDKSKLIPRSDLARLMSAAVLKPDVAKNTRFDLCVADGPPTTDYAALFTAARPPWQQAGGSARPLQV